MTNQVGDTEMAEKGPDKSHNLTDVNENIQNAFEELLSIDGKIDKAMETYVSHLKKDLE